MYFIQLRNHVDVGFRGTPLEGIYADQIPVMSTTDAHRVIFDTGTTLAFVSTQTAAALHALIPSARYIPSTSTWTVPCDLSKLKAAPAVYFGVGGARWAIPATDLAFQGIRQGDTCLSAIQGGASHFVVRFLVCLWLSALMSEIAGIGRRLYQK